MTLQPDNKNRLALMILTLSVLVIGIIFFMMPIADAEDNAIVKGYVYEKGSGTEVEGVGVNLWGDQSGNYTETDVTGYYQMGIPDGDVHVHTDKDGYKDHDDDITLSPGEDRWYNITIAKETAVIKGYVEEYESRGPIEDASINIWDGGSGNGTSTDENGYYEMNLAAGSWFIWANADGYSSYYQEFDIEDYQEVWINVSLRIMNSMIKGYITDEDSRGPIEGAFVNAWGQDGGNQSQTDASGYYEFWIFEGDFHFSADKDGYYSYGDEISIGYEEIIWMNVSLEETPPENSIIKGYVNEADRRGPIEGASIDVGNEKYHKHNETDGVGYYELNIPQGQFSFDVHKDGYKHYGQQINVGENDTIWLNVTLEKKPPETSVVKGYIYGEESRGPLEGAWVGLYNEEENEGNQTGSNQDGYYEIRASAATYIFYTGAEGYVQYMEEITIGDHETIWINKTLKKETAKIMGYITDDSRAPLENARVGLDNHDAQMHHTVETDGNGYYERTLVSGDWYLEVNADDHLSHRDQISLAEDEERWYNVTLDTAVIIHVWGVVTDNDTGTPIAQEDLSFWADQYSGYPRTDDQGNYEVWIASDLLYEVQMQVDGYRRYEVDVFISGDTQYDIVLMPIPPPDVTVMGYVDGYETRGPLEAMVGAMSFELDTDTGTQSDGNTGYFEFEAWSGYGAIMSMANDYYTLFKVINFTAGEMWYNITLYPVPENDASITGYVIDANGESVEDAQVLLANDLTGIPIGDGDGLAFPYMTMTDDEGYYEMDAPAGDWYLVIVGDGEAGIVIEVTVVDDTVVNVTLPAELPEMQMSAEITDWDNIVFMNQGPFGFDGPAYLTRLQIDFLIGDRNGNVNEEEALDFEALLEIMMKEDEGPGGPDMENTTDEFSVDGIDYDFIIESITQNVTNFEGEVTSTDPVNILMTGNLQSQSAIPVADLHTILLNQSYPEDEDEPSVSMTIILPPGFILESYITTDNVTVEGVGTDTIVVTSVGEPVEDGWEWVTLTAMVPNILPTVDAGADQVKVLDDTGNVTANFTANATDTDGQIILYEWDFDFDGTFSADFSSANPEANFTYDTPGNYTVMVQVTDNRGGKDNDTLDVDVKSPPPNIPPTVDAGPDQIALVNQTVLFTASAIDIDGLVVSYEWDFDYDGTFSADISWPSSNITHTYHTAGDHTAMVRVTDDDGATANDSLVVKAQPPHIPSPNLQIDSVDLSILEPVDGDEVEISVTLKNTGDAEAETIKVRIYMDGNLKDLLNVSNVAPNSTVTVTYTWTVEEGEFTIRINMTYAGGSDETTRVITVDAEEGTFISGFEVLGTMVAVMAGAVLLGWHRKP